MLYKDSCTIIECRDYLDPVTHITSKQEVVVHENVPCKISYRTQQPTGDGVAGSLNSFLTVIQLSPDLEIKTGSKIIVNRNGREVIYKNSGQPDIHFNHQAITVRLWDDYA